MANGVFLPIKCNNLLSPSFATLPRDLSFGEEVVHFPKSPRPDPAKPSSGACLFANVKRSF